MRPEGWEERTMVVAHGAHQSLLLLTLELIVAHGARHCARLARELDACARHGRSRLLCERLVLLVAVRRCVLAALARGGARAARLAAATRGLLASLAVQKLRVRLRLCRVGAGVEGVVRAGH